MSKRLNAYILFGTLTLTMSFFACGDSGSTDTPKGVDMSVSAMEWLPNCTENREGMAAFVEEDNATYECKSGKWRQYDIYKEMDENNAPKSSNSQEVESVNLSSLASTAESSSSFNPFNPDIEYGELTDSRDGQTYKTVVIGSQTWMAENLDYAVTDSYCYDNDPTNCSTYGRLYTRDAAANACPEGWHLPSHVEFKNLLINICGSKNCNEIASKIGWMYTETGNVVNGKGSDAYGFSALPAGGVGNKGEFVAEGWLAYFWRDAELGPNSSTNCYVLVSMDYGDYRNGKIEAHVECGYKHASVRCIKDTNNFIKETMVDSRDGQTYKIVTIGSQTWMAENLNYQMQYSYCYYNKETNCDQYGRLYAWSAALNACPSGWHLPTKAEFETLIDIVGGKSTAGTKLKSQTGWNNATDDYGFSALPAGGYCALCGSSLDEYFQGSGENASFWSATLNSENDKRAHVMVMGEKYESAGVGSDVKSFGNSVRCLKDDAPAQTEVSSSSQKIESSSSEVPKSSSSMRSSSSSEEKYGTLTDARDGQIYKTVKIGDQVWMAENLNYREGHGFCYNSTICTKYGRLYAWSDALNACPSGWHLPTKAEFETLIDIVGGQSTAGKILKSTSSWKNGGNGTDAFGFSALPAGFVDYLLNYSHEGYVAYFWSSTEDSNIIAYNMVLYDSRDHANLLSNSKDDGYSIRCLKDSP